MRIDKLKVNKIEDSRGEETIEIILLAEKDEFNAKIPSGRSRGEREAIALDFENAKKIINGEKLSDIFKKDFKSIRELDDFLIKRDGTLNKSLIGGNVMLGISIAFARAVGKKNNIELWEILRNEFFQSIKNNKKPSIFANIINGGAHAKNNLDIQEYQVVVKQKANVKDEIKKLIDFYNILGERLGNRKKDIPIGDERGYAPNFKNNFEPIKIIEELIKDNNLDDSYSIGIDVAASNFEKSGKYFFENIAIDSNNLINLYKKYFKESKLLNYIEDPFSENDSDSFRNFLSDFKNKIIIGDDLTVTKPEFIDKYSNDFINGVIIKPNQIGTVSETCDALNVAKEKGIYRVVSHRSGEVDDSFVIHFAKAADVEGVKIGIPNGERLWKFKELERLYK